MTLILQITGILWLVIAGRHWYKLMYYTRALRRRHSLAYTLAFSIIGLLISLIWPVLYVRYATRPR